MDSGFLVEMVTWRALLLWAPLALVWSYVCLTFAGYLKTRAGFKTGYTRKVFHVLIFLSAATVHAFSGFAGVCLFGTMVTLVVGYAILRGPGSPLFEAIGREKDGAYRSYFIVIPYFATLIGGLASNVLFGPLAVVGYLVGGLGDAAGEPVGTRWGKRHYAFGRAMNSKTIEGSIAVLFTSLAALFLSVALRPELHFDLRSLIALPVIAVVCTLVEAVSPRGWDNAPMQLVPTLLVAFLLTT
jgi:Cytidylyltransferase family.